MTMNFCIFNHVSNSGTPKESQICLQNQLHKMPHFELAHFQPVPASNLQPGHIWSVGIDNDDVKLLTEKKK